MSQDGDNGYQVVATKVSNEAKARLDALCESKGITAYELLQMMVDTLIRYMDDRHNLTPEMERAMSIFEHMRGWKNAFNLADYTADPDIVEAIYFICDPSHQGVRAVMMERPWLEGWTDWNQTFNVRDIMERMMKLTYPERYQRLSVMAEQNGCSGVLELIDMLIDEHSQDIDIAAIRQGFEDANRSEYGRKPVDAPYRRKHRKSIDDDRLTDPQMALFDEQ